MVTQKGIMTFQKKCRYVYQSLQFLNARLYRCNEIAMSILTNIENNFVNKTISTNAYHLYTSKMSTVQNELMGAIENKTLTSRHLCVTRAELEISDVLSYITCTSIRMLLNWLMSDEWVGEDVPNQNNFLDKFNFIDKNFIALRYSRINDEEDDTINIESPDDFITIDATDELTRVTVYNVMDDSQYYIFGNFRKDSIDLCKMYTYFNNIYSEVLENISGIHVPPDFKYGFLEQMRVDDIVGKSMTNIISHISVSCLQMPKNTNSCH